MGPLKNAMTLLEPLLAKAYVEYMETITLHRIFEPTSTVNFNQIKGQVDV